MNNWKVVSIIFFGWGSVFLFQALFVFIPIFDQGATALVASAPYFVLAALLYVGGVFGYYKGRENIATLVTSKTARKQTSSKVGLIPITSNETNENVPSKMRPTAIISNEVKEQVSSRIGLKWSIPVGVSTTCAVLALSYFIGVIATSDMVLGIFVPILIAIAAGLLAVLYTCLIIGDLD